MSKFLLIIISTFLCSVANELYFIYDNCNDFTSKPVNDELIVQKLVSSLPYTFSEKTKNLLLDSKFGNFYYFNINSITSGIIYIGKPDIEEILNVIWIKNNNENEYTFISDFYGKIKCSLKDSDSNIQFIVSSDWCCGADVGTIQIYKYFDENTKKIFRCFQRIKIPYNLNFPENLITPLRFIIQNEKYKLRASPEINNLPDSSDLERYGVIEGNTLASIEKNSTGTAYAESIDSTGRKWWFVILDKNTNISDSWLSGWGKKSDLYCGWLSSRFTTVISR